MNKALFVGVARDCARFLPSVLSNIEQLSSIFKESSYIFIENDSKDSTKIILNDWGRDKKNFYLINLDGLGVINQRGLRLEFARNAYWEFLKSTTKLHDYDLMIVMDMDDANTFTIDKNSFSSALNFLYTDDLNAAVFANQIGTYYDMWTLRHPTLCNADCWEEIFDYVIKHQCSDGDAFNATFNNKIFSINKDNQPIEVDSAFGGLGIYKLAYVLKNKNPYLGSKTKLINNSLDGPRFCKFEVCEHVHFNLGILNEGGKLFIFPALINGINLNYSFPVSAYRQFVF